MDFSWNAARRWHVAAIEMKYGGFGPPLGSSIAKLPHSPTDAKGVEGRYWGRKGWARQPKLEDHALAA